MPIQKLFKTRPQMLTGGDWDSDGWTRFIGEEWQGVIPIRWHHRALERHLAVNDFHPVVQDSQGNVTTSRHHVETAQEP